MLYGTRKIGQGPPPSLLPFTSMSGSGHLLFQGPQRCPYHTQASHSLNHRTPASCSVVAFSGQYLPSSGIPVEGSLPPRAF